jgi:polyisoprenyl-phosphate glycosyltransferase
MPIISLVIPVYNEEALVEELIRRSVPAMKQITEDFEIICVDDGSTDSTLEKLLLQHQKDKRVKIVSLSRNFGHQAAYTAGLSYARANHVAMMDGDLQDPPELLKLMQEKLVKDNLDVVYGKRTSRNEAFLKKNLIKIFHRVFKNLTSIKAVENVGNFSIMNRKALDAFLSLQEKNRYIPGLRFFIGFKQGFVDYDRPDREEGEAKMNFVKLMALASDAIFSFSKIPVKVCLYSGVLGMVLTGLSGVYILLSKITNIAPLGWSSLILSIYFIGSVQLLSIGILGEYVYRIYKESQNRPIFLVRDFIE